MGVVFLGGFLEIIMWYFFLFVFGICELYLVEWEVGIYSLKDFYFYIEYIEFCIEKVYIWGKISLINNFFVMEIGEKDVGV